MLSDVNSSDIAVAIFIKLAKCFNDPAMTNVVRFSTDLKEELIKVNGAILISVQDIEENFGFSLGDCHTIVLQAEVELLLVKFARAVICCNHSEWSGKTTELSWALS